MRKITRSFTVALALLLITTITATAGGWAVITLDELPGQIVAGQSFTIGFTVRQHGRTLRDDLAPILRFNRSDAKDSLDFTAKREGDSGHYVASVTLPNDGQWNWKVDIEQFGMVTQDMSPLTVVAAAPANALAPVVASESASVPESAPESAPASATIDPVAPATNTLSFITGVAGAIVAIGALAFWLRTRARFALVVVAVAALVGVIGFTSVGTSAAQPVTVAANVEAAEIDRVALGRALFVDKGCVMCHTHSAVPTKLGPFWIGDEPPVLTAGKYSAEYLRQWLKDPASVKPDTVMPQLHLSDVEIAALSAFLGAK